MQQKIKKIINKKNKSKIICLTAYSKNIAEAIDPYTDIILIGDTVSDAEAASQNGSKSIIVSRIDDKKAALEESSATIVVDDLNQVNING